ncbi:14330_t:CDS:2 [Racocetra fulgida]|uniref:14330_t:CDS:1 n=1 Tax=Racocetra fulgida TaxID=60492 RepID=A0A9N8ZBW6_9GLOM|nr:14330_t:CDS:2 [Racocetra fulgida]
MTTTTTSLSKHIKILEGTKDTLTTLSLEQTSNDNQGLVKSPQEMNFSSLKEDENAKDEHSKDSKDEHSKDEHAKDEHTKDEHAKDEHPKDEHAKDENVKDENAKDENAEGEKQKSNLDRKTTIDKRLSTAVTEAMKADDAKVATKIENDGELVVKNDLNMSEITKYQVVLNNLHFALHEIVAVMESLTNVPEEEITCNVVHIASRSVSMLEQETRERLYKSIARFWDASQRTTAKINPNITFYLREIRCCLKKIKDDQTKLEYGYLILMERLVMEFPQPSESGNNHSLNLLEFCQEILDADVKKQLSAKAIELLLIIHELVDAVHGSKIEDHLNTWGVGKGKQRKLILDQIKVLREDKKKILKTIETARTDYEKDQIRQQSYNVATTYNIEQKVEIGSHVETQNVTNIENINTKIEKVETLNVENTTIERQFIENIENKVDVENQFVENVETKIENVNVNVGKSVDVENQLVENVDNIKNVENVEKVDNVGNVEKMNVENVNVEIKMDNVEYVENIETQYVETRVETQYIGTQNVENVKGTNAKIQNINVVEELDSQNLCVETIENVQTININNYETKNINEIKNNNEIKNYEVNNTTNVENINNEIITETIVQNTIIQQVVQPGERQSHWLDNVVAVIKDVEKRVLGVDGSNRKSLLFPNHDDNGKRRSTLFSDEAKRRSTLSTNDEAKRMSTLSTSDEAKRKSTSSNSDDEAKRSSTPPLSDDEAKRKSTTLSNDNDDEAKRKSTSLSNNDEVANNSTVKDENN